MCEQKLRDRFPILKSDEGTKKSILLYLLQLIGDCNLATTPLPVVIVQQNCGDKR